MGKVYTLDDNGECMAELKAMHDEKKLMKVRLERDEITPDEWRGWYAGYRSRLDEIREAVSGMRDELSLRNADLERQKRERASELNLSLEEYENYLNSLQLQTSFQNRGRKRGSLAPPLDGIIKSENNLQK
jgi:hypothetical protein